MAKSNTPKDPPTKPADDAPFDGATVTVAEEVDEEILPEETTGALVKLESVNIGELLSTGKGVDEILAEVRRQTVSIVPDLSTDKGRKQIRALAYRVSRTRALMDQKRLEHTKNLRDEIAKLNGNGNLLLDGLAAIRDEVRKPLTDWEAEEEMWQEALLEDARREAEARELAEQFERDVQARIDTWTNMPTVFLDLELEHAKTLLAQQREAQLLPEQFGDRLPEAQAAKDSALTKVENLLKMKQQLADAEAAERQRDEERLAEAAERQRQIDDAAETARREEQEKADRKAKIDRQLEAIIDDHVALANRSNAEQITEQLSILERTTFNPAVFGDRLGDAYAARTTAAEKVREILVATQQREAEAARLLAEQKARERRDEIAGRIQGLQTKPLIEAAACGTPQDLEALERRVEAKVLDPADFDDQWDKAQESRATVLAKLHELVLAKWQAHNDAIEAARLRQEAAEREAREEQERQAEAKRAKQAANEAHRKQVRGNAAEAISRAVGNSITIDQCTAIVAAIESGEIPNIEIHF